MCVCVGSVKRQAGIFSLACALTSGPIPCKAPPVCVVVLGHPWRRNPGAGGRYWYGSNNSNTDRLGRGEEGGQRERARDREVDGERGRGSWNYTGLARSEREQGLQIEWLMLSFLKPPQGNNVLKVNKVFSSLTARRQPPCPERGCVRQGTRELGPQKTNVAKKQEQQQPSLQRGCSFLLPEFRHGRGGRI